MINRYAVIKSDNIEVLINLVNQKIQESISAFSPMRWIPIGGICIESNPHFKPVYYQSMVETYDENK